MQQIIAVQPNMERLESEPHMNIEEIILTPELAKEFLELRHPNQRNINHSRVKKYSEDMKVGRWRKTGDPIRFDDKGYLIDGQHRLEACIKANATLPGIIVIRSLTQDTMLVLDQGQKRTQMQAFKMAGEDVSNDMLATTRALCWTPSSQKSGDTLTTQQLEELWHRYENEIRFVVKPYGTKRDAVMNAAVRVNAVRALVCGYDREIIAAFLTSLDTGVMAFEQDKSAIQLRNAYQSIVRRGNSKDYGSRQKLFCLSIAALKHYFSDTTVERLLPASKQVFVVNGLPT